jgi:altronate dehydratase
MPTTDTTEEIEKETTETLVIQDESQFRSMVEAELEKHGNKAKNTRYEELEKALHDVLHKQDSE